MDKKNQSFDSKSITKLLLKEGREVLINTTGLSMGDSIRSGETIVARKVLEKQIRFGDVIIFERKNEFVCHRIVRILKKTGGNHFLTKGDSLKCFDEPVKPLNILGKVTRIKKQNGDFIMDSYQGRITNTVVGLFSFLLGILCRFFLKLGKRAVRLCLSYRPSKNK